MEGDFDGDLTFEELARHGDLGLGTLNGLDGEMIALDGRSLRASVDGDVTEIAPSERTPFAVVICFEPTVTFTVDGPLDHDTFLTQLGRHAPPGSRSCALRIDGRFARIHARSIPRQLPPYSSLAEVAHEQHVFDLEDVEGTVVAFRFPKYAQGLEVPGYHLHFVDAARRRGGHVLSCVRRAWRFGSIRRASCSLELAPGVELGAPGAGAEKQEQIHGIEGES